MHLSKVSWKLRWSNTVTAAKPPPPVSVYQHAPLPPQKNPPSPPQGSCCRAYSHPIYFTHKSAPPLRHQAPFALADIFHFRPRCVHAAAARRGGRDARRSARPCSTSARRVGHVKLKKAEGIKAWIRRSGVKLQLCFRWSNETISRVKLCFLCTSSLQHLLPHTCIPVSAE